TLDHPNGNPTQVQKSRPGSGNPLGPHSGTSDFVSSKTTCSHPVQGLVDAGNHSKTEENERRKKATQSGTLRGKPLMLQAHPERIFPFTQTVKDRYVEHICGRGKRIKSA